MFFSRYNDVYLRCCMLFDTVLVNEFCSWCALYVHDDAPSRVVFCTYTEPVLWLLALDVCVRDCLTAVHYSRGKIVSKQVFAQKYSLQYQLTAPSVLGYARDWKICHIVKHSILKLILYLFQSLWYYVGYLEPIVSVNCLILL